MKIKAVKLRHEGGHANARCCVRVNSTGTGHYSSEKHRCAYVARYRINGKPYCSRHAGEKALAYLVNQSEK